MTYKVQDIDCQKEDCGKKFKIITSPLEIVVTRPTEEITIELRKLSRETESNVDIIIDDYIVVKCPHCSSMQRVYLKNSNDE